MYNIADLFIEAAGGEYMLKKIKKLWETFLPFYNKIQDDNVFAIAGQSTFYFLLAVVPLTMFAVSILQNLHIPQKTLEDFLGLVLNENYSSYLSSFLSNMYKDSSGISIITIIVTLWSASQGIHAIINGLNRVHNTHENRNWLILRFRAMIITFILVLILFVTMSVFVLGRTLNELLSPYIKSLPEFYNMIYDLRYFIVYIYLVFIFALIYKNVPNLDKEVRKKYGLITQFPGAVLCATAWFALSLGISVYVDDFNGFSIYGGLTRLAVIMVWLNMCLLFLMLGAEVNVVYYDKITTISGNRHPIRSLGTKLFSRINKEENNDSKQ